MHARPGHCQRLQPASPWNPSLMHLIVWRPLHQPSATLVSANRDVAHAATNWHKLPVRNCQVRTLISADVYFANRPSEHPRVWGHGARPVRIQSCVQHDLCKLVLVR